MEWFWYVNCRSCCNSYFIFASSSRIFLPSFRFGSSSLATIARWMSSIAPVLSGQRYSTLPVAITHHDDWPTVSGRDEAKGCLIEGCVWSYGNLNPGSHVGGSFCQLGAERSCSVGRLGEVVRICATQPYCLYIVQSSVTTSSMEIA